MINALFIVWRESFEAVLIVGILYVYLKRQPDSARAMKYMWGGVLGGVILSALLGFAVQAAQTELQGRALEFFQAGTLALAALLMTQMCIWMKRHSRFLKSELETGMGEALSHTKLFGVATLA